MKSNLSHLLVNAWRSVIWRGWRKRCPKCGQGAMFGSYFEINKQCPECQVIFQPYAGDSLGVYAVCYFLTLVPSLVAAILACVYLNFSIYQGFLLFSALSTTILIGLYPNMKGLWVGLVYLATGLRPRL